MEDKPARIVVTGVNVPFGDLVDLMVKLVIAAIPAGVVLGLIVTGLFAAGVGIFGALGK